MSNRPRLPGMKQVPFWALAMILAGALLLVHMEIEQLWPEHPLWFRTVFSFATVGIIGEWWVSRYWPVLRSSRSDVREVMIGFGALMAVLTLVIIHVSQTLSTELAPEPVAWVAYLAYVLLDASYHW